MLRENGRPVALRGSCESDDGARQVVGDGMVEKALYVKRGDLRGQGDPSRSQNPHTSDEAS